MTFTLVSLEGDFLGLITGVCGLTASGTLTDCVFLSGGGGVGGLFLGSLGVFLGESLIISSYDTMLSALLGEGCVCFDRDTRRSGDLPGVGGVPLLITC